ncbi:MAG: hypothetical protein U9R34_07985, partial [Nanoarchaeota archaeon]|nr:hypothetical protein [Nanoarchaeota archaeon]
MAKKTKSKNRKIDFAIIILLIIIIMLILWIISLNQDTHKSRAIKDYTELPKNRMTIKNETLEGDHLYSFDLHNTYDITKECSVTAIITVGPEIVSSKDQYVGKIKPGKSAPVSINLDELP